MEPLCEVPHAPIGHVPENLEPGSPNPESSVKASIHRGWVARPPARESTTRSPEQMSMATADCDRSWPVTERSLRPRRAPRCQSVLLVHPQYAPARMPARSRPVAGRDRPSAPARRRGARARASRFRAASAASWSSGTPHGRARVGFTPMIDIRCREPRPHSPRARMRTLRPHPRPTSSRGPKKSVRALRFLLHLT